MSRLTHLDDTGAAHMVDVSAKADTMRTARAEGVITMSAAAIEAIRDGHNKKGDAISVSRVAGIMAAKKTSELVPLCHPLALSSVTIDVTVEDNLIRVTATTRTTGPTGVEMEALTAVSVALLTLYDMAKALDRAMVIGGVRLLEKSGGRTADWVAC